MIFDTHAHYDDAAFNEDREQVLGRIFEQGIERVVNVGASIATSKTTVELCNTHDFIYGAVGVHPSETAELDEEKFSWLKDQLSNPKIVAVGEIGLDYYWDTPEREIQKVWFQRQLELAIDEGKPVIIHSRDAAADTLVMMKEAKAYADKNQKDFTGVIHCFSYSTEMANEYIKLGFYLGIGGVLTFKNAKTIKEVVAAVPMSNLVLETDCPYLAPVPRRGERNDSGNIPYVVNEIADIKNLTPAEILEITTNNANCLYGLK